MVVIMCLASHFYLSPIFLHLSFVFTLSFLPYLHYFFISFTDSPFWRSFCMAWVTRRSPPIKRRLIFPPWKFSWNEIFDCKMIIIRIMTTGQWNRLYSTWNSLSLHGIHFLSIPFTQATAFRADWLGWILSESCNMQTCVYLVLVVFINRDHSNLKF